MITAKRILEHLISRLEAEVGDIRHSDFAAWEGEEKKLNNAMSEGRGHRAQALLMAKEALASGDEERIAEDALLCPMFERTGNGWDRARGVKARSNTEEARIKAHGTRAECEARWLAMAEAYEAELAKGKYKKGAAREVVGERFGMSASAVRDAVVWVRKKKI